MRLETNCADRKALANQISEQLNLPMHYNGVPTCSYSIGTVTIDRQGVIETEDTEAWETLQPFFRSNGWVSEEPEHESEALQAAADYITRVDISIPANEVTPEQVKNFCRIIYSKQTLLNRAYGQDIIRLYPQELESIEAEETLEGIQWIIRGSFENGTIDGFRFENNAFTMTFPHTASDPEIWELYSILMNGIINSAMVAKRVKKEISTPDGNGKYLMHTWLIRMGFGGTDFKTLRKLMLERLDGCCAFPDKARAEAHKTKYAEIRRIKREFSEEAEAHEEN